MLAADLQIIISTIGWALVHFLWQGTLITLGYWVITRSIESIHAKYWTGMILVVISLLTPFVNSTSSKIDVGDPMLLNASGGLAAIPQQQMAWSDLLNQFINLSLPYVVLTWLIVVTYLTARLIKSWINLASITHDCDPSISRDLKRIIKNVSIKLDLPNIPLLKVSNEVLVPAAYGVLKPTVLLPLSLIGQIPREQLEAIIKHELCHLKRNDFVHNIIQLSTDILFFFHPGIRWMNNDIRHIREQCCDQMVLEQQTEALTYAKALTNIASYTSGLKLSHSVHLGVNDGKLLNRVKILLQNNSSQSSLMVFLPLMMLFVVIALLLQPEKTHTESLFKQQLIPTTTQTDVLRRQVPGHPLIFPKVAPQPQRVQEAPLIENNTQPAIENNAAEQITTAETLVVNNTPQASQTELATEWLSWEPEAYNSAIVNAEMTTDLPAFDANFSNTSTPSAAVDQMPASASERVIDITTSRDLKSFQDITSIRPEFKKYQAPNYPQHFWTNQIEQDVIATFNIKSNGRVHNIQLKSQGNQYAAFETEVLRAMKKWRFDVNSLNASTQQQTYQQIFTFAISEDVMKTCETRSTGSRLRKTTPCKQ